MKIYNYTVFWKEDPYEVEEFIRNCNIGTYNGANEYLIEEDEINDFENLLDKFNMNYNKYEEEIDELDYKLLLLQSECRPNNENFGKGMQCILIIEDGKIVSHTIIEKYAFDYGTHLNNEDELIISWNDDINEIKKEIKEMN